MQSCELGHPHSYIGCVADELFTEDVKLIGNKVTAASAHHRRLLVDSAIPDALDDEQRKSLRITDTFCYLMAAQHADLCVHVKRGGYRDDLFLDLYRAPYKHGILQQRFFEFLRDIPGTRKWSALMLCQETRSAEGESSSKRQIDAWKHKDGKSNLTPKSLQNLLEHSLDKNARIDGDLEVYWEGYRVMLIMRRVFEELEQSVGVAQMSCVLNRYCRYYEHHKGELASWDPRSPFATH